MKGPAESGQICSGGRRKIAKKIAKKGESCKNVADGGHDRLIRMKANLTIGVAPDEADMLTRTIRTGCCCL
jgi:hypothetical protein